MHDKPNFVITYLQDILYFNGLQISQVNLLYELFQKINFDNQIVLNSSIKQEIADELNLNKGTIDNAITKFVEAGILVREGRGVYIPNKKFFSMGNINEVKSIKVEVNYDLDGRKFKALLKNK